MLREINLQNIKRVVQKLNQFKQCLIGGYPFIFDITVYESLENDEVTQTGIVPMPDPSDQCLGGHAIMCVGFNDDKKWFIIRNSLGDKGYFYLPYEYVINPNLALDFWTIRRVVDN